jgi:hypothetical protein
MMKHKYSPYVPLGVIDSSLHSLAKNLRFRVSSKGDVLRKESYSDYQIRREAGSRADRATGCSNLKGKMLLLIPAEMSVRRSESCNEDDNAGNDQANGLLWILMAL